MAIKKLFVFSLVMLATAIARADGLIACIYNNGELQERVLLSKKPVLKLEGDNLTMQLDESQSLEIPALGTVVKFEAEEDVPVSINAVSDTPDVPAYRIDGNNVSVSGLRPGEMVRIYSINGQQISATRVGEDGCVTTPITKGILIINAGKTSIKLINK